MHPTFTNHARERCAEMGFSTKRAKRALRSPGTTYGPDPSGGFVHVAHDDEEIAVVFVLDGDAPIVLTVLWHTQDQYSRGDTIEGDDEE